MKSNFYVLIIEAFLTFFLKFNKLSAEVCRIAVQSYRIICFLVEGILTDCAKYVFYIFCQDKEPYISQRVEKLVKTGVVNALVAFGKSESENSNELLSRYLETFLLIQIPMYYLIL